VVDEGVPENLRALILRFETSDEDAEPGAADDRVAQVDCENPA
jgi:hypothetical protein